ncbi:MAG TPA: lipid IV(A) 3-deoxy-D-manno-octulosonic acid transferase [Burkholderiales bacterium]|nr:lipid IV(A) 3-deoxy-D-manno-octulosonic acid transferase [Burkholderiales bacterium]
MSVARLAYSAVAYLAVPAVLARLAWRSRAERGYAAHVAERFGLYGGRVASRPLVWVHAVSVGETHAAEPIVRALQARYPDHRVLLTHMTPTGRRAGERLYGDAVERAYLPYDLPDAVSRFLEHFRPAFGVIMETEIWPNLVHACRARGVPLFLANARLSERSYLGYRRLAALARESVERFTAIAAQTGADAERLRALGARNVTVTGSVKFDVAPPLEQLGLGRAWRESYGERPVVLAASTREGEEALVLDAFAALPERPLLVVVPRHPQRFDEVAALIERRGLAYVRRSAGIAPSRDTRIVLGDSMGEMPAYYAAADVAYIGGSLLPFGGQNLIEACAVGTPVFVGPHTYNFTEAAGQAVASGAAIRVADATALAHETMNVVKDEARLREMRERALEFARAHQGATDRVMQMIAATLP